MTRAARRAMIGAVMDAFAARGAPVKSARILVDGSLELLTEGTVTPLASNDTDGDWVSLAGETEIRRA